MKQHIASSRTTLQRARRLRRYPFPEDWELQRVQCTIVPMTEPQSVDGRRLLPASLPNATVVNGVRVQHRRMWQEYRHAQSNVDSPYRVGWMWLGTHRWSPTEIIRSTDGLANCAVRRYAPLTELGFSLVEQFACTAILTVFLVCACCARTKVATGVGGIWHSMPRTSTDAPTT